MLDNSSVFLVGGTFNTEGGRPSGYFRKLRDAILAELPDASSYTLNGGTYQTLAALASQARDVKLLVWFADVPNDLPKLLPSLKVRFPQATLIQSKNNRRGLYSRAQLLERMSVSGATALVEFTEAGDQRLLASVLLSSGSVLLEKSEAVDAVARTIATLVQQGQPA